MSAPITGVAASEDAGIAAARRGILRRLLAQPSAVVSISVLAVLLICAIFSQHLFGSPTQTDVDHLLEGPTAGHWFGTDELGRDLLARVAYAGRLSLGLGVSAMLISLLVAAAWGLIAASGGGWIDEVLMRTADAMLAIPMTLFALVCVAAFGVSLLSLTVIIGLLMTPQSARVMRAAVLTELRTDYVRGLTAVGAPRSRILWREVLPNALPSLLAQATLNVAVAVLLEASLSFLGVGIQPPSASWGTLLSAGYAQLITDPWYVVFPACAILLAIGSLNVLGGAVQRVVFRSGE